MLVSKASEKQKAVMKKMCRFFRNFHILFPHRSMGSSSSPCSRIKQTNSILLVKHFICQIIFICMSIFARWCLGSQGKARNYVRSAVKQDNSRIQHSRCPIYFYLYSETGKIRWVNKIFAPVRASWFFVNRLVCQIFLHAVNICIEKIHLASPQKFLLPSVEN